MDRVITWIPEDFYSMKIHKISWFDDFKCMGGDCPQTCCRGWLIPLDEDDLERFKCEKGLLGIRLLAATGAYTRTRMNLGSGECTFHTREGLCSLQLKKGHDFIPWACRSFPRFYRNYGDFEERYLDLSCFAAARLFIENIRDLSLVADEEEEPATRPCTTNDDMNYLKALLKIRQDFLMFREDGSSGSCRHWLSAIYSYACKLQDAYAKGGDHRDLPPFHEYQASFDEDLNLSPLKVEILNEFVDTAIYNFGVKKSGPELLALLNDARSMTVRYLSDPAGFLAAARNLFDTYEKLLPLLNSYMSYYLYQYFLGTYETYSFRKVTALGIIHTNMILLLTLTDAEGGRKLADDDFAYIISIYNRKAFFNETIEDEMYRIFSEQN
ncbi:MAG TPA: hypothetical protein DIS78_04785 [Lachnospiraceae bacterium]|nr:hypothetical protein [Lachnospiraceae bacterium]